jgi:hypothetical protein
VYKVLKALPDQKGLKVKLASLEVQDLLASKDLLV